MKDVAILTRVGLGLPRGGVANLGWKFGQTVIAVGHSVSQLLCLVLTLLLLAEQMGILFGGHWGRNT